MNNGSEVHCAVWADIHFSIDEITRLLLLMSCFIALFKGIAVTEFKAVYASPVLSLKRRKLIKPFNMYQNPIEQRDETKIFFGFFACLFDLFWAI